MSLSLEVKKFINSEHTGQYVSVVLPSELPVERAEVREVNRDKSAANSARNVADNKARLAAKAKDKAEQTLRARNSKQEEYEEASRILDSLKNKRDSLKPDLDDKRAEYERVNADYQQKNRVYTKARDEYLKIEADYNKAVEAEETANNLLEDSRAKKSGAEAALTAAKEGGKKNESELSSAKNEAENAKVKAAEALALYEAAAKAEADADEEYKRLVNSVAELLSFQKEEAKRAADCQKQLAAAAKELTKASAEYSSASEAVSSTELLINTNPKYDNDAQKAKLASLKEKQAAAKAKFDAAQSASATVEEAARAADSARNEALNKYSEENERLLASKAKLDELKIKTQEASLKSSEAKQRSEATSFGYERSQGAVKDSADAVKGRQQDVIDAEQALSKAEGEIKTRREDVQRIKAELEKAKAVMDEKQGISSKSEKETSSLRSAYEKALALFESADGKYSEMKDRCEVISRDLDSLDRQLQSDRKASRSAADEAAESQEEAEKLRASVRTISTKYETANIHYLQQGVGEDIILIHSVGQSLYTFRELINKLSGNFRVTALDLVGFGYSDKPYYFDYTMDEMADFIDRFMTELGINTANFYGFSMGAGYVVNFARRYPERVERIVLMCPGGITPEMPLSVRMLQSKLFGGLASRLYNYKSLQKMLTECFFDLTCLTDDLLTEYYRPASMPDCRRVVHTCIQNFDDEALLNSLRDVGAETLLLWGNEDKWHPTEMADIFRNVLPNVTYNVVRNAGHLAHEEKADKVAQLIKTFIPCGYEE